MGKKGKIRLRYRSGCEENYLGESRIFSPGIHESVRGKNVNDQFECKDLKGMGCLRLQHAILCAVYWWIRGWVLCGMGMKREEGQKT